MGYQVIWTYQLVWGCAGLSFFKCIVDWYWFGLVLRNDCKKGNVGSSKELMSKNLKNPCSCFGYRLSYSHPNEVIPIGKEP